MHARKKEQEEKILHESAATQGLSDIVVVILNGIISGL